MCRQSVNIIFVCFVASLVACVSGSQAKSMPRIIGGQLVTIDTVPYTVQLRDMDESLMCGGTLVSAEHVVTAAHCFEWHDPIKDVVVVAGATSINERGIQRRIVQFFKPTTYTRETMHTDVVVLKLKTPVPLGDKIQPVPLCSAPLQPGNLIQVSGWGRIREKGPISPNLRSIRLPIIPHEECVSKYADHMPSISDTMECAFLPKQDACQFDSGGPGLFGGELCAVVSFGLGCAYEDYPGVYTNVHAVRDFIKAAMKQ